MDKSTPAGVHFRHIVCGIVNIGNSGILKREWQWQRPRRLWELHNKANYERMEILPNHPRYDYTDASLAFYSKIASFFVASKSFLVDNPEFSKGNLSKKQKVIDKRKDS